MSDISPISSTMLSQNVIVSPLCQSGKIFDILCMSRNGFFQNVHNGNVVRCFCLKLNVRSFLNNSGFDFLYMNHVFINNLI